MDKKDFSEILNNVKDLTIGQIIKIILNLKYRTIIMILGLAALCVGSSFAAGKYSHQKETAVMLESPFAMRIIIDDQKYDFNNLTLIKDPMHTPMGNKIALSLREIKSAFDIVPLGTIIAQIEAERLGGLWDLFVGHSHILSEARAQTKIFNWYGHQNDYRFKEKFISQETVHRFYSDGCILEYRVDKNRKSIPHSFIWIRLAH